MNGRRQLLDWKWEARGSRVEIRLKPGIEHGLSCQNESVDRRERGAARQEPLSARMRACVRQDMYSFYKYSQFAHAICAATYSNEVLKPLQARARFRAGFNPNATDNRSNPQHTNTNTILKRNSGLKQIQRIQPSPATRGFEVRLKPGRGWRRQQQQVTREVLNQYC